MVVGEASRFRVVDRQGANQPVVEHQRTHQRRLQRRLAADAAGLEVGARPCVHQRTQIAAHPAHQALAVLDRERLQHLGVDACGEPAAEHVAGFLVEEERAGRERHQAAQLRRDERHRVGHAEAGAHRLRDLVERVDLAMRQRDVLEHARGCLIGRGGGNRRGAEGRKRQPSRRLAVQPRLVVERRQVLDEQVHQVRVEGQTGLGLQRRQCVLGRERAMLRPLRGQRVEVIHHREDARAKRNLIALEPGRIALAIPSLVVAVDDRRHRIRERHRRDDLGAHLRMHLHPLELLGGQRTGLRQDVLGHRELADVVQQRRRADALYVGRRHADDARQARGMHLHPPDP